MKKLIIAIVILFIILVSLLILKNTVFKPQKGYTEAVYDNATGNVIDTTTNMFSDIKDLFATLNISYLKGLKSSNSNFYYDFYVTFNEELSLENQNKYVNCIKNISSQVKYYSYRMIDEKNNIEIAVYCDSDGKKISKYTINNDEYYFNKLNNQKELDNFIEVPITEVRIEANSLKFIIDNSWKITEKVENNKNYIDYIDNSKIKIVNNKIFNLVYTSEHKETIIDGLKPTDTYENIVKVLGKPAFEDKSKTILGYKTQEFYVFFTGSEISIYRNEDINDNVLSTELVKLKNNNDINSFVNNIFSKWQDYDSIEENGEKKNLNYTLKGIEIQNISELDEKIIVYSNCTFPLISGKKLSEINSNDIPSCVTLKLTKNLIFTYEKERYDLATIEGER